VRVRCLGQLLQVAMSIEMITARTVVRKYQSTAEAEPKKAWRLSDSCVAVDGWWGPSFRA